MNTPSFPDPQTETGYRVYLFDGPHIKKSEVLYAASDAIAIVELQSRAFDCTVEMWDKGRIVVRIEL